MKKLLAILLCITMLSGIACRDNEFSVTTAVTTTGTPNEIPSQMTSGTTDYLPKPESVGLEYTVNEDGITCTIKGKGECTDTKIYIPEEIEGYQVTAIANRAFYACTTITEIMIPQSVKHIGTQIFYKCDGLKTVYYNSTFSPTTENVFLNYSVQKIVFGGKEVPSNILYKCPNIKKIDILGSVESIGDKAFYNCEYITSVTISNGVKSIGDYVFYNCNRLTDITIPNSVTSIGDGAFYRCRGLVNLTLSNNITNISDVAFYDCSGLINVIIPNGVTNIGEDSFSGCKELVSIMIPDSVISIGEDAFVGCSKLINLTIPDSVRNIDDRAFYGCSGLTSVVIGDTLSKIGDYAFYKCDNINTVYCSGAASNWGIVGSHNESLILAERYYYKDYKPIWAGNYWHYVEGVPTVWTSVAP